MTRIQPRRDVSTNWTSVNPVLAVGELGFETDTGRSKRGDGSTEWTDLGYDDAYMQLARNPDLLIAGTITRNSDGAATSAPVVWPDGSPGTYTATTLSTDFPGAVDAYTITYGSPVTKTYTQSAVTRDSSGAVTAAPEIGVS